MLKNPRAALISILLFAALLRALSVAANADAPHGDVHLDAVTLHSLASGQGFWTPLERAVEMVPPDRVRVEEPAGRFGYFADQHPPLILIAAWPLARLGLDAYEALQWTAWIFGVGLVLAAYLAGRRLFGAREGLLACAAVAASFALADFSGNGSIYAPEALFLVLAVAAAASRSARAWFAGGACLGLAWLSNYQAAVAVPAVLAAALLGPGSPRRRLALALSACGAFALVAIPWCARNLAVFGDPLFSVNPVYLKAWLGAPLAVVERAGTNVLEVGPLDPVTALGALKGIFVVNARMFAAQSSWWLGPLLAAGAAGAVCAWRRRREPGGAGRLAAFFVAAALSGALVLWPAAKFRYLVPIVPLFAVLAAGAVGSAGDRTGLRWGGIALGALLLVALERAVRGAPADGLFIALGAIFLCGAGLLAASRGRGVLVIAPFVASQAILLGASPTRTTYYDAILVGDAFGRKGVERDDRARQKRLCDAVSGLAAAGARTVLGPIELKAHALAEGIDLRVVQPFDPGWVRPPETAGDVLGRAIRVHDVDHALATGDEERALYAAVPGAEPVAILDPGDDPGALTWTVFRFDRRGR